MSSLDTSIAADYSAVDEWRKLLRLKPSHSREIVFGFLFRLITGIIAVILPAIVITPIAALNSWKLTSEMLFFYGAVISVTVLIGEHLRSRAYERILEDSRSKQDVAARIVQPPPPAVERKRAITSSEILLKRVVDIFVALSGLILLSPLFIITSAAVKFDSRGPVLFRQRRVGYKGRPFVLLKFRTMRTDLENAESGAGGRDPRVTAMGEVLRRSSLDELPQLLNVLRGDMSLVGPRPDLYDELQRSDIKEDPSKRYPMKPGLTGWAQVNGFGKTAGFQAAKRGFVLDNWYVSNWSIWLDLKILLKSVFEIIRNDRAD